MKSEMPITLYTAHTHTCIEYRVLHTSVCKFNSCSDCAKVKAKQVNVPKGIPDEKRS